VLPKEVQLSVTGLPLFETETEIEIETETAEEDAESEDWDANGQNAVLEGKANQDSHVIAILQDKVIQLSTDVERFVGEVCALRSVSAGIQYFRKRFLL
jgi:hypothetical protein